MAADEINVLVSSQVSTHIHPEGPVQRRVESMRAILSNSLPAPAVICPDAQAVISPDAQAIISTHFANVRRVLMEVQPNAVERIVDIFREARDRESFIYIAGNGGSSSTASHWANDLGKATKRSGRRPLKVMCLADNMSWFSALSNDEGYERAFSGQLENFATPGDVLACISASGNSPNLVRAVELARRREVTTAALVGFDGGALKGLVDEVVCVHAEKGAYELVEDVHSAICHAITRCLVADRAGPN
jgi:D-sedoheptulose 7-phosphate isomerase